MVNGGQNKDHMERYGSMRGKKCIQKEGFRMLRVVWRWGWKGKQSQTTRGPLISFKESITPWKCIQSWMSMKVNFSQERFDSFRQIFKGADWPWVRKWGSKFFLPRPLPNPWTTGNPQGTAISVRMHCTLGCGYKACPCQITSKCAAMLPPRGKDGWILTFPAFICT